MGKTKIAFFDAKDYDKNSFMLANQNEEFDITYYEYADCIRAFRKLISV